MENKNKGNEKKVLLGHFNCTTDKMNRDSGNGTQRIYRCRFSYTLSKFIVHDGLKDLDWEGRTQIPLGSHIMIDPLAQDQG